MLLLALDEPGVLALSLRALIPAAVIGVIGSVAIARSARARAWIAPCTLAAAVIATHPLSHGGFAPPWSSAEHLIPVAALAAMVMGLLAQRVRFAPVRRWCVRALVLVVLTLTALRRVWLTAPTLDAAAWLAVFTASALLAWSTLEHTVDRARGAAGPATITLYAAAAAVVVALTGAHSLALSCAAIAAAAAPAAIATHARPHRTLAWGGAHVPALLVPFILFMHLALGGAPPGAARAASVLVLLIPIGAASADWPHVIESDARRTLVRLGLGALVALAACAIAAGGFAPI